MISIIIPIYNGAIFLEETINSALSQSFKDFEILLINDGSTDNSQEIINKYISKFPNMIKGFYQKNHGVCSARNFGIKEAIGDYIAFLDQDDIWLPEKLDLQFDILDRRKNIGFVMCAYFMIDSKSVRSETKIKYDVGQFNEDIVKELFLRNVLGPPSCALVRKKCFDEIGYFDVNISSGPEDRDMWLRLCKYYSFFFLSDELCGFRFHENNAHKNVNRMKKNQKNFIKKHKEIYKINMIRKSYAYIYLDAAREFWGRGLKIKTFINSLYAILLYPAKIEKNDDKYKLFIKSIIK